MLHNRLEIEVEELRATVPPVALALSAARKAELEKVINGAKPKNDTKAQQAAAAKEKATREVRAARMKQAVGAEGDDDSDNDEYSALDRAVDGAYVRIRSLELTFPQFSVAGSEAEAGSATGEAAPLLGSGAGNGGTDAQRTAAMLALKRIRGQTPAPLPRRTSSCTLGCVSCAVRWPRWLSGPRKLASHVAHEAEWMSADITRKMSFAGASAPPPSTVQHKLGMVLKFDNLELQNCKPDFSESHRLVPRIVHPQRQAGSSLFGALFRGGGGGGASSADSADLGPEVHVYKRLIARKMRTYTIVSARGVRVPMTQPMELAILVHMVKAKRTGRMLGVDADLVFPDGSVGWLVDPNERVHGRVRIRTEPSPLAALAMPHRSRALGLHGHAPGALSSIMALGKGGTGGAAPVDESSDQRELARWRRHVDALLTEQPSMSPLDSHVRDCLSRRLGRRTLLILEREHRAADKAAHRAARRKYVRPAPIDGLASAGELLWLSPELQSGKPLAIADFMELLRKYEINLSDDALEYVLAQQDARATARVDLSRFLKTWGPDELNSISV